VEEIIIISRDDFLAGKPSAARTNTKGLKRGTCNQPDSRSGQSPARS
jgi:hypothetical protein